MMGKKNQEEKNTFTSAALLQFRTAGGMKRKKIFFLLDRVIRE
jgi:hypothetical protein